MKKMMFMAVALLSMSTATFAADENANASNAAAAYSMNINMDSLTDALGLTFDQREAVSDVHKTFNAEMMNVATAEGADKKAAMNKAIEKDLKYMHAILNNSQYHKYLMLLNATINNRGLNK